MEFHPSYARAVVRASGSSGDASSASSGAISLPPACEIRAPVAGLRFHSSASGTPRLIDLERRAKFARASFTTA